MNNNKGSFLWCNLQLQDNENAYGLGNQILYTGMKPPMIGGVEEIPKENIQQNRSCDLNDFFKQYICLFTNIVGYQRLLGNGQLDNQLLHAIVQKGNNQIVFQLNRGEVVQEQQQNQAKAKNKQKQESSSDLFTALIQQVKREYKEQIGNLGKILQFKHPPIIDLNFVLAQGTDENEVIQPYINSELMEDEFEFVSYHLSDANPIQIINSHIQQLIKALSSNKKQVLYFNDKTVFPINKYDEAQKIQLFKSDFKNNRRLIVYKNKINNLIDTENNKILNVHHYLSPKALDNGKRYFVRGDYVFHHYMQDGFDDKGWGCAYRSFQSVLSWLMENGYTSKKEIPNHKRIQQILVEMGDKPINFVGTSEWIGAFEVSMLITHLTAVECKILNVSKGTDVVSKLPEFKSYFENYGAPIMFGGGLYAYTLLGIDYNDDDCRFLILDPHYTANDTIKSVIEKQGVSWRKADMFEEKHFYNFCMPLIQ
ncbi:unnamed protein product [Paramecium octaurelia]|uniref:UFSP1/2/DUB catalytic domain-containing protein n=1 Tax=Paramecium octaurelia TaxID=43137 RepID=A0A8S1XCK5_PAROT|nr:unnamed protein product [Paramecium octaurelia]